MLRRSEQRLSLGDRILLKGFLKNNSKNFSNFRRLTAARVVIGRKRGMTYAAIGRSNGLSPSRVNVIWKHFERYCKYCGRRAILRAFDPFWGVDPELEAKPILNSTLLKPDRWDELSGKSGRLIYSFNESVAGTDLTVRQLWFKQFGTGAVHLLAEDFVDRAKDE